MASSKFVVRLDSELVAAIDNLWPKLRYKSRNAFLYSLLTNAVMNAPWPISEDELMKFKQQMVKEMHEYIDRKFLAFLSESESWKGLK